MILNFIKNYKLSENAALDLLTFFFEYCISMLKCRVLDSTIDFDAITTKMTGINKNIKLKQLKVFNKHQKYYLSIWEFENGSVKFTWKELLPAPLNNTKNYLQNKLTITAYPRKQPHKIFGKFKYTFKWGSTKTRFLGLTNFNSRGASSSIKYFPYFDYCIQAMTLLLPLFYNYDFNKKGIPYYLAYDLKLMVAYKVPVNHYNDVIGYIVKKYKLSKLDIYRSIFLESNCYKYRENPTLRTLSSYNTPVPIINNFQDVNNFLSYYDTKGIDQSQILNEVYNIYQSQLELGRIIRSLTKTKVTYERISKVIDILNWRPSINQNNNHGDTERLYGDAIRSILSDFDNAITAHVNCDLTSFRSIKKYHDKITSEYNIEQHKKMIKHDKEKSKSFNINKRFDDILINLDDTFTILTTEISILELGIDQSNCVGNYSGKARQGIFLIMSGLDNGAIVTIGIELKNEKYELYEAKLKYNAQPSDEFTNRMEAIINKSNGQKQLQLT